MLNAHTIFGYGFPLYLYFTKTFSLITTCLIYCRSKSFGNRHPSSQAWRKPALGTPFQQVQYLALARRRPSWPAPRAVPGAGKPGRIAGGVVPRRYRGFVRARASSEGLWARAWDGPNVSRSFETHTGSSVELDGALHGRCGDIHRCRSPEKTCPEGLTRAWEDLLYPKKTGKVCHGRSLGAPWTSADVLQRFWSLWRFWSLSGDPADLVAPLVGSMMEKKTR